MGNLRWALAAVLALGAGAAPPSAGDQARVWFRHPAPAWNQALPLGNGRLGAMVFGDVRRERLQLNESSLWMGKRSDRDNPEALANLAEVRRLLFAGRPQEASDLAERKLMGRRSRVQPYQYLADLRLTFDREGDASDYEMELDLDTAVARVRYRQDGVTYTREAFVSAPDQVVVLRLSADSPAKLSFSLGLDRLQDARMEVQGRDRMDLIGALGGGQGLSFQASVKVLSEGGRLEPFVERIAVVDADAVTLIVAAATSFRGEDPRAVCDRQLAAAAAKPFARLRADHVADQQRLFRRVALRLGAPGASDEAARLPTDERLARVQKGERDLGLEALYFQFG